MTAVLIACGAWLLIAVLFVWFLRASRRRSDKLRVSEPPKADDRSSISIHKRILGDK